MLWKKRQRVRVTAGGRLAVSLGQLTGWLDPALFGLAGWDTWTPARLHFWLALAADQRQAGTPERSDQQQASHHQTGQCLGKLA